MTARFLSSFLPTTCWKEISSSARKVKIGRATRVLRFRLVITPSCDLLQRAPNQPPTAQSVLLLPGTLKYMDQENKESNLATGDFVRVMERDKWRLLQVKWDFTRPIAIDWMTMCDKGPGKAFKRMGRVRDLYFHRVRDQFANSLTRIGTEVAPLFPHPRNGKVLLAIDNRGRKRFEPVMDFTSLEQFVWEIGPVLVTRHDGKLDSKYLYQASRQFISKLTDVLEHLRTDDPDFAQSVERSVRHLKEMDTYMDLVRPMIPGRRGVNRVVEFKKAVKRSNENLESSADLLIATFID